MIDALAVGTGERGDITTSFVFRGRMQHTMHVCAFAINSTYKRFMDLLRSTVRQRSKGTDVSDCALTCIVFYRVEAIYCSFLWYIQVSVIYAKVPYTSVFFTQYTAKYTTSSAFGEYISIPYTGAIYLPRCSYYTGIGQPFT